MKKKEIYAGYLREAYLFASENSQDPNTQTGVVVIMPSNIFSLDNIIFKGANRLPRGIKYEESLVIKPKKYDMIAHAERDCIHQAHYEGISLKGAIMFSPWLPCAPCAEAIINSGISKVVMHQEINDLINIGNGKDWGESQKNALELFEKSGVICEFVSYKFGNGLRIKFRDNYVDL
jgi:deoxycytidylate deaminase